MKGEYVQIELPLEILEHLFTAFHVIRPNHITKLEKKALDLLKDQIFFNLEIYMELEEEAQERKLKFRQLFEEARQKKTYDEEKENAY